MELQPVHTKGKAPAPTLPEPQDSDAASELLLEGHATGPTGSERYDGNATVQDTVQWSHSSIGLIVAACFTLVVALQWVLVCILSRRPISNRCDTYEMDVICDWSTPEQATQLADLVHVFDVNADWIRATQVLASGLSVLIIPITTAVCARAGATMATTDGKGRNITLMQTLTLANKSWMDPMFFYSMTSNVFARRAVNWMFLLSFLLTVLGTIIFPLQSILVTRPTVLKVGPQSAITGIGIEGTLGALKYGYGPFSSFGGPGNAVLDFQGALGEASLTLQGQPYTDFIWYADGIDNQTGLEGSSDTHWTSLFPTTTSTGFLRNYSLGIGSSVKCSLADFPDECAGDNPFTYDLEYPVTNRQGTFSLRLCIPGDMNSFSWQSNGAQGQNGVEESKQTITETLYMDYSDTIAVTKSSIMCTCDTSSGYFELPNQLNGTNTRSMLTQYDLPDPGAGKAFNPSGLECGSPSLMLGYWPTSSGSGLGFSDNYNLLPSSILNTSLPDIADTTHGWADHCGDTGYPWTAYHGPLLSSILVLFTNASDKNQCRQGNCPTGYYPPISSDVGRAWTSDWGDFSPFDSTADFEDYPGYLNLFLNTEDPVGNMQDLLQLMTLLASMTALQLVGQMGNITRSGQGLQVVQKIGSFNLERINLPLSALIVLSIIITLYMAGMLFVGVWGSRRQSWTPTLDALAMLMMGARLHALLPPLEGHALDGVGAMGKEFDHISGGITRGENPLSQRSESDRPTL
ncbi:hypothetical protein MMC27_004000 [Xylographa pallens]|nr:hypothetical protein [Xylographa pallens]